ncbi:MAG: molybdopterin dinucleotide binding domain-containing protein, partial [Pseudomonadota bacterium]
MATGRIGRPGMGPFSATGQPNAMGGREVGGLANMLAAHMALENPDHRALVQSFWKSPEIADKAGLKAVDLFRAVGEGKIKALWILSTNPAVSMPDADGVAAAIAAVPFTVVSDMFADTDTARLAHVLLPAAGWGEKSGTVTNSDRTVSRQRAFLKPPGEARPDWRAISDVAATMGWGAAFDYASPAEIFREHAALSAVAAALGRDFDLSALAGIGEDAYAAFEPARWPLSKARRGGRFFGEGGFFTPDRKARMLALTPRPLAAETTAERPFRLNTGRARDHWHTMTRTGRTPRLSRHIAEPYLEIHPADAARVGLRPAEIAEVSASEGRFLARALVTERAAKGSVFAPMHWTGVYASAGRADAAVAAAVDPVSGQPELKGAAVAVARFPAAWHAFAASAADLPAPPYPYWAKARAEAGWRWELAGTETPKDWEVFARALFGGEVALSAIDRTAGTARIAVYAGDRLSGVLAAAPAPVALDRAQALAAFARGDAAGALRGGSGAEADAGPVICACNGVGAKTILAAASACRGDLDRIADATGAGAVCGSCR